MSRYFDRVPDYLNVDLLRSKMVVIVGLGMVGSPLAEELARCTVGHFRLIDHDVLEEENLSRHVLTHYYLGWNKAEGMAHYLADQVHGVVTQAIPRQIDATVPDAQIDHWLADADLIIAATDDRTAQRRVMQSALALDIPAIAPALHVPHGGEIIIQSSWRWPCFGCWDYFRTNEEQLRGARALGFTAWPLIHATIDLSLGFLDPRSGHGEIMIEAPGRPPNQIFTLDRLGTLDRAPGQRRPGCPSCGGGPAAAPVVATRPPVSQVHTPLPVQRDPYVGEGSTKGCLLFALGVLGTIALLIVVIASSGSLPAPKVSAPYQVRVDYTQPMTQLLRAAHLQPAVGSLPLPSAVNGMSPITVKLVNFVGYEGSAAEAVDHLSKLGYRSATLRELLAFVTQYPEAWGGEALIEFGSPTHLASGHKAFYSIYAGSLEAVDAGQQVGEAVLAVPK